jgi:glutathione S-transferase
MALLLFRFSIVESIALVYAILGLVIAYFRLSVLTSFVAILIVAGVWRAMKGSPATMRSVLRPPGQAQSSLSKPNAPPRSRPRFILHAMPINHFGEKVRWALDRAGVHYEEVTRVGILWIALSGTSVPSLVDRWTASTIGNSDEILLYVSAVDATLSPRARAMLAHTAATAEWTAPLNELGHAIQGWAYHELMCSSMSTAALALRAWGAYEPTVPLLERAAIRALFPLIVAYFRSFWQMSGSAERDRRRAVIERVCASADDALAKTGGGLCGPTISFIDLAFAALLAPLFVTSIVPAPSTSARCAYANGRFTSFTLSPVAWSQHVAAVPPAMLEMEAALLQRPCGQHVQRLYAARSDRED